MMPRPAIDCGKCRQWAVHCVADLEPVYALGCWHHPAHADDLLQMRYGWAVAVASVRMETGEAVRVSIGVEIGELH